MAYAVHKMPQIGELAPGYWLASAFGGHGLNTTAMAGEMIARAILDGDDRWRLFSPYELVWAGGRLGRAAAQTLFWSMQMRDSLQEKIARYRDRARREAERGRRASRPSRPRARPKPKGRAPRKRRGGSPSRRRGGLRPRKRGAPRRNARGRPQRKRGWRPKRPARALEQAEREREHMVRAAAEKAPQDAAEAAAALTRQIEGHKAETAAPESAVEPVVAPEAAAAPEVVSNAGRLASARSGIAAI